ncbi:hypothetical protein Tco_0211250 [Tanacetum coccineum]
MKPFKSQQSPPKLDIYLVNHQVYLVRQNTDGWLLVLWVMPFVDVLLVPSCVDVSNKRVTSRSLQVEMYPSTSDNKLLSMMMPAMDAIIWILTMSVLVDACSLALDPHASTLALEDASNACTLANIHALAFSMSFQEGFSSLSLHPYFEPQNMPLSLYSSDK